MSPLTTVVRRILEARGSISARRSVLAAVTGIDGCGKGYVTQRIVKALQDRGVRATGIGLDDWLNLPSVRFSRADPAGHFYRHAIRFDEMFAQLILPLRDNRSLHIVADCTDETSTEYRRRVYEYEDIDVIVLEGIYLLKRALRIHYDLSFWVDCSFETALQRALARAQEGLPPEETVRAYRTIYFPAQEIHIRRDNPVAAATAILNNDPRLGPVHLDGSAHEP